MLNGKQKRFLRSLGMTIDPILTVGKEGVTPMVVRNAGEALQARELIKGRVLQSAPAGPADVAAEVADGAEAIVVQVIGRNFLLYRPNPEAPRLHLPE